MTARESFEQEEAGSGKGSSMDKVMIDFASVLEDFLDEEVVDKQGVAIGTLACYWQSVSGRLVFLGIKLKGQESTRIVPGRRSQVDDRQACIRLGFEAADIEAAPCFDCAQELDATLEHAVYEHFHLAEAQPHGGQKHVVRPAAAVDATGGETAASVGVTPATEAAHPASPRKEPTSMNPSLENSPLHHTQKLKAQMVQLIDHLHADIGKVTDPQARALFETSAEVVTGLVKAFDDYEQKNEGVPRS